jgi:hypothetical protein
MTSRMKPKASKPHFLLDLDQTIISAESLVDRDKINLNNPNIQKKAKKFKYHEMKDDDGKVIYLIFERPHLQPFLTYLFANFNVSVMTAATKSYAISVVEQVILKKHKNRKLHFFFFKEHYTYGKYKGIKPLRMLWQDFHLKEFNAKNTVILDDLIDVHKTQPHNCIIAKPFEFKDKQSDKETFLKDLLALIKKKKLSKAKNIQPIVDDINKFFYDKED